MLATNNEFLAAKFEELGVVPATGIQASVERGKRQEGGIDGQCNRDDTDWLDEVEVTCVVQ